MHSLALLAGKAAFVIKEAEVNEDGFLYAKIKGGQSGLITWFLELIRIDATAMFEVYKSRIELTEASLFCRLPLFHEQHYVKAHQNTAFVTGLVEKNQMR